MVALATSPAHFPWAIFRFILYHKEGTTVKYFSLLAMIFFKNKGGEQVKKNGL